MQTDELDQQVAHVIPYLQSLARTYNHPSYEDPWQAVLDHRRVISFQAQHPDRGSQAIASMLDLPRSRIRPWLDDGAMPDAARATFVAETNGWFVRDLDTEAAKGMAGLVAWIFAGGSINGYAYVPYLAVRRGDDESIDRLRLLAEWYGVDFQVADRDEPSQTTRAVEYRPITNASILGRCLHIAGAPIGAKTARSLSIPRWLKHAPEGPRRTFAATYIAERATKSKPYRYQLSEEDRGDRWLHELSDFILDVAGDGQSWISNPNIAFDKAATDSIEQLVETTF